MHRRYVCPFLIFILELNVSHLMSNYAERIIGGTDVSIRNVPYMLSYRIRGSHACGASILDKNWAVTAAHCVLAVPFSPEEVTVKSGSSQIDSGGVVHNVTRIIPHEDYNPDTNDYDIAVLKVDPPFSFDDVTQPLDLPNPRHPPNSTWAVVCGWGYFLGFDPILSEDLQCVLLPKVDHETCVKDYRGRYTVTPRQICYGLKEGGRDACKGDSGGALVAEHYLIGITSWGDGCALPRSPGVYTDVLLLVPWIQNKTDLNN